MSALKNKTVSVPISESDVKQTLSKFPRTPTDARLTIVQLKRSLDLPGIHSQRLINLRMVLKALSTFISLKNPFYENILQDDSFKQRCRETDPEGYSLLYSEDNADDVAIGDEVMNVCLDVHNDNPSNMVYSSQDIPSVEINTNSPNADHQEWEDEREYIERDPIARNQFNYNNSTCFGDNHPEINVEENTDQPIQIAPV